MNCNEIETRLNDYLDGTLPDAEKKLVEIHLEGCLNCREELLRLRNLMAETAALPKEIRPERDLWPEIAGRMASQKQAAFPSFFGLRPSRLIGGFAVAAIVLLIALGIFWKVRQSSKPFWEVGRLAGNPKVGSEGLIDTGKLRVGEWLETDDSSRAVISVGTIGHVQVEPNSRIRLVSSRLTDHRLSLAEGSIQAQISAPPRLFFVETPSALAVDLGCSYNLAVDESGAGQLQVTFGWVALVREGREVTVPAGAVCLIRPAVGPGTPFFQDASPKLRQALQKLDFEKGGADAFAAILAEARPADLLTLWHLLPQTDEAARGRLYNRMAKLAAPPEGITKEGILRLEPAMLQLWKEEIEQRIEERMVFPT